ncbi:DUF3343 domain-containing protein [Eubacteriaceae bacterium ES3]|nr:DUF3343 domain-containing protein [Eubacteriaceae bacterium ES3]
MDTYSLLTFDGTHRFMMAESILKDEFEIIVIPTLREISAGCGISIKIDESLAEAAYQKLRSNGFSQKMVQLWLIQKNDGVIKPQKIY